jgi:hypothetical protein
MTAAALVHRLGSRLRIEVGGTVRLRLGTGRGTRAASWISGLGKRLRMRFGLRYAHERKIVRSCRDGQVAE